MAYGSKNDWKSNIEEFPNEINDEESDLLSEVYDSDVDPEYQPGRNNTNIYPAGPSSQNLPFPLLPNSSDDDSWVKNYLDIPEFDLKEIQKDSIGIQLEINGSARYNPIENF